MQGSFNFWSIVLLISIGQAAFLACMLAMRISQNRLASRLLLFLAIAILIVNTDYFLMSSRLFRQIPSLIGISFGLMYAFGPLFYLYLRAVADDAFRWKHVQWLHFLPWVLNVLFNTGFYLLDGAVKISIVNDYLQGKATANGPLFYVMNSLQVAHLLAYLAVSYRFIRRNIKESRHVIPMTSRMKWVKMLFYANVVFVTSFVTWFVIVCLQKVFIPPIDYVNTMICSAMVYIIAYKLVIHPEILAPGFEKKYRSSTLSDKDCKEYVNRLQHLMEQNKLYTEPDLKLHEVADQLGIRPHLLSQIINQQFGKTFIEYVNTYRVEAFQKKLQEPDASKFTLLALATGVGFNSKSAFNTAFRKVTGKSPSGYKNELIENRKKGADL